MNSVDGYFDITADRTKIVTVPVGYEVRLHKTGSSEDVFPDGLSTKDIKDLNNTLVVDLSTPGTIDLKGTLLSNGQPLPSMDGVDTEIDKKITALNLSGTYAAKADVYTKTEVFNKTESSSTFATITALNQVKTTADAAAPQSTTYNKTEVDTKLAAKADSTNVYTKTESSNTFATKAALTTVETTANAAAPQSTTYTKTECDGKFAQPAWVNTTIDNKIAAQNIPTTYATITSLNEVKATADAAAPQTTTYTKTECDGKYATITTVNAVKTTADAAAPKTTVLTFDANKVLSCPDGMKVTDISTITVVNGSFLFKDTGEVYLGVNGAWVQLGVTVP